MKEHLRRTIAILRAYPVLWVPYVVATVLAYCLDLLRHVAERRIVYWEFSRQVPSVLGGNFSRRPFDASAMETVHRLRSVLVWAVHYVNISIFAVAMVLTAMLAYASLCNEQPAFAFAAARLTSYPKRILVYAAKAWFLMLVLNAILYWPIYLPAFHLSWQPRIRRSIKGFEPSRPALLRLDSGPGCSAASAPCCCTRKLNRREEIGQKHFYAHGRGLRSDQHHSGFAGYQAPSGATTSSRCSFPDCRINRQRSLCAVVCCFGAYCISGAGKERAATKFSAARADGLADAVAFSAAGRFIDAEAARES